MITISISGKSLIAAACFTALGAGIALLAAGPLTPPSGAVTSTNKTLSEVEPRIAINSTNTAGDANSRFRIAAPGSYYLTGNITAVGSGLSGIEIASSNVTIDLNGYSIISGLPGSLDGITTDGVRDNITIRNGTVTGFASDGINLTTGGSGEGFRIEGVSALNNGGYGIRVASRTVLRSCIANGNGLDGVNVTSRATISECIATGNALRGVAAGYGSTLTGCTATDNTGDGFSLPSSGTISNCLANSNAGGGFFLGTGCFATNCIASTNGDHGFSIASRTTVLNCSATANSNAGATAAGIYSTGDANRIEGNHCIANNIGIDLPSGQQSIIAGNICRDSTAGILEIRAFYHPVTGASALIYRNFAQKRSTGTPYSVTVDYLAPVATIGAGQWYNGLNETTNPWANFEY